LRVDYGSCQNWCIGAGAIAQVVHLPVLKKTPGAELVAIAEHDNQRLQIIGKQYGIPNLYQDYHDLLNDDRVEVVDICTSTETHYQIALEALRAGKNIIIEKPPTVTLAECKELAEAAEKAKKIVLAGMNNRFRSDFMMLKSYIYDNQLGDIFYINAAWHKEEPSTRMKLGGSSRYSRRGVVLDLGIVLIDLAVWLLNFPKIKGINAAFFSRRFKKIEDTALVTMRTNEGAMIRLDAIWGLQLPGESFKFEVYGTNGTAT
jgi:Predicted dehydrogenases and related proteins